MAREVGGLATTVPKAPGNPYGQLLATDNFEQTSSLQPFRSRAVTVDVTVRTVENQRVKRCKYAYSQPATVFVSQHSRQLGASEGGVQYVDLYESKGTIARRLQSNYKVSFIQIRNIQMRGANCKTIETEHLANVVERRASKPNWRTRPVHTTG
jgi:hypothetical protein